MGANPLEYLNFGLALKGGFDTGLAIQRQRDARIQARMLSEQRSAEMELERQREARLLAQQKADLLEKENIKKDKELARTNTNLALIEYQTQTQMGAEPGVALAESVRKNPGANLDDLRNFVPSLRPPTTVEQIGEDITVVNGTPMVNPRARGTQTALQRNVDSIVDAQKRAGIVKDETDAAALRAELLRNNGKIPQLSEGGREKLAEKTAVLDLTDQISDDIEGFNAKYGKDAFDAYIGRVDAPIDTVLDILRKREDPESVDALKVMSKFAGIRNRTLKTRSGGAVTEGEYRRLQDELGDKADKNLVAKLRTFRDATRNDLKVQLGAYENINLPKNLVEIIEGRKPSDSGQPARVTSKAEYDALKPGQKFIDGSGKVKTKK